MIIDSLHTFSFDNSKLSELGAVIAQHPTIAPAEKNLNFISVPRKSGDIVENDKSYKNIDFSIKIRTLPTFCNFSLDEFSRRLVEWLDTEDYKVYRDTYARGYFRHAICKKISPIIAVQKNVFEATIDFNFKPFLYNDCGIREKRYSGTGIFTLKNPEEWSSEPVITVNGNGIFVISVNDITFRITLDNNAVVIDKTCENVYYKSTGESCNDIITANEIPELEPGTNIIMVTTVSGTNFTMSITPNWRRL